MFPILRDPVAFETLITHFMHHLTSNTIPKADTKKIDVVVGLDARGFLLGPIIALRLGAAFVPVRKQGKLPGQCVTATYEKEYGTVGVMSNRDLCCSNCASCRIPLKCKQKLSNLGKT